LIEPFRRGSLFWIGAQFAGRDQRIIAGENGAHARQSIIALSAS
jgi:hypothetical protein